MELTIVYTLCLTMALSGIVRAWNKDNTMAFWAYVNTFIAWLCCILLSIMLNSR